MLGVIFSGLGTALFILFLTRYLEKQDEKLEEEPFQRPSYVIEDEPSAEPKAEVQEISERFLTIFELMNEGRGSYKRFTKAKLAQIMDLETSDLENVMLGKEEASSKFRSDFCQVFGVNEVWIRDGTGHPYKEDNSTYIHPSDYFNKIKEYNPEYIYFIRAKTELAEVIVVLQLSEWKFRVIPKVWHISGYEHPFDLFSLYRLIKSFQPVEYTSRTLDEQKFDDLRNGVKFPGTECRSMLGGNERWADCLTDVYHEHVGISVENYEQWYGRSFVEAQEIIRNELEQDKRFQS